MYKVLALIVLLLALIWFFAPKSQAVADSEKKKPAGTGGSCQCNGGGEVASAGAVTGFAL